MTKADRQARRGAIATAMFDAMNTARLSEHPEEAKEYGKYADGFMLWLEVAGYKVIRARRDQPEIDHCGWVEEPGDA